VGSVITLNRHEKSLEKENLIQRRENHERKAKLSLLISDTPTIMTASVWSRDQVSIPSVVTDRMKAAECQL
jgi:hypothetical protein